MDFRQCYQHLCGLGTGWRQGADSLDRPLTLHLQLNEDPEPERGTCLAKATQVRPPMALDLTLPRLLLLLGAAQQSFEQQRPGWRQWPWGMSP